MQKRFQKSQRESVRSNFGRHPLLLTCQYAFKQFEGRMPALKMTPEEIFYEAAILIDRIMEEPGDFDQMLPTLWDDLLCEYMDFDRTVPQEELVLAVSCVYYATIGCFALHNHAGYCFTMAADLMEDFHHHNPNWKVFENLANEKLHFHSSALNDWINSYSDCEDYLSDEIEAVVSAGCGKDSDSGGKLPFKPIRGVFSKTSLIVDGHLALVCQELTASGWIATDTNPDEFLKLFSGKNNGVKIVWTGKVGIGSLKALFEMMEDNGYITSGNNSLNKILRSHFVTPTGDYIGDFRGCSYTTKSDSVIESCRKNLEVEV